MSEQNERQARLDEQIRELVSKGWRVESQSDYQAVMVKGKKTNHLVHLVLTILSAGLWAIVWVIVAAVNRESRWVITA